MTPSKEPFTDEEFARLLALPDLSVSRDAPGDGVSALHDPDLRSLRSALHAYRTESTQWAERHSAAQPSLAPAARRSERWAALPQWSLALVAVVSIAGGIVHLADLRGVTDEPAAAAIAPRVSNEEVSQAYLAADNRLLSSIDEALSYHAASPIDSLHLKGAKPDLQQLTPLETND